MQNLLFKFFLVNGAGTQVLIELENPNIIKPRLSAPCSTFLKIVHTSKDTCECSLFAYWKTIIFAKSFSKQGQGGGPAGGRECSKVSGQMARGPVRMCGWPAGATKIRITKIFLSV
jgi:hypothetical protein